MIRGGIIEQNNRETIERCRKVAVRERDTVPCTVRIAPEARSAR
jgi:hypothetical protein